MSATHHFFITAPRSLVGQLARELRALGVDEPRERAGGVACEGPLELGYRACLWSRLASRVLLEIGGGHADDPDTLYQAARAISWQQHLAPDHSFAVHFSQAQSAFTHTHYAALRIKDALVDQWRERSGDRPSVDLEQPGLRIHAHVLRRELTFYIDLAGQGLHRRGYRVASVAAPLKENVAAGLLVRAGWPELAAQGAPLLDPLCGSGTLLIEAAWMAADVAPGLLRDRFGAAGWVHHDEDLWQRLRAEAEDRRRAAQLQSVVLGGDLNLSAVQASLANVERAGLTGQVRVVEGDLGQLRAQLDAVDVTGLVVTNPPYGERMGERAEAEALHARLGEVLREQYGGWRAGVLTVDSELAAKLGLRARRRHQVMNGALECQLLEFDLLPAEQRRQRAEQAEARREAARHDARDGAFANRLRKNLKKLVPWATVEGLEAYRLYDADIPEYALSVDRYGEWLHVQAFDPPRSVDRRAAQLRVDEVLAALPELCGVQPERIALKTRVRQRGRDQYLRQDQREETLVVGEGALRFEVNLHDYLDTGLFLDGRWLRQWIVEHVEGQRLLNLFGYTGAVTVAAIVGKARATTTVDLSNTYLDWAGRNLRLNGAQVGRRHRLERADCLQWLQHASGRFDLIYLDPPTFSNSKSMQTSWDVQRDHAELILRALELLSDDGALIFVTNRRGFRLDKKALGELQIEEWTEHSVPRDFTHRPRIHRSYRIRR